MRSLLTVAFFFIFSLCFSQSKEVQSKMRYYTEKAQNYLDKEKSLASFYTINENGISMFSSAENKSAQKPEFFLDWKRLQDFSLQYDLLPFDQIYAYYLKGNADGLPSPAKRQKRGTSEKPLQGYKIALDPGHIANTLEIGDLEKKHIQMKTASGDSIEFAEGMLTYATAVLLKEKLESSGAEVFITRKNGTTAFGQTFEDWKKANLQRTVDSLFKLGELKPDQKRYFSGGKAKDRDIFRVVFRDLDLAKRVELINKYKPDITIIIHYNVDETNLGWSKPSDKNLNMTFIGGAFMKNDLSNPEKRFEFLRLLASEDLENSIELSTRLINSFEKNLKVKTADVHDAKYLVEGCFPTGVNGVYCRNLQLTRYIHSTLVYGETLFQDNAVEMHLLNKESDKTKNERVKQVAESYYRGILSYITLDF